jgi:hypothetical protein
MSRQTGLKVMNSARCILYQVLREMFNPVSQFPLILRGRREIDAEFGARPLEQLWCAFAVAQKNDLSVTIIDSRDFAICRKLAELAAANLDVIMPASCRHDYKEHLDALFELDNYFGGLVPYEEEKSSRPDLALTAWDRDFLRRMKISI